MKMPNKQTTVKVAGVIAASLALVVSFQNCGKAGFDSSLDSVSDYSSLDAALTSKYGSQMAAKITDIPFAFDGGFDQIAYNSCAESGTLPSSSAYYSIRAGAYQTGGITIPSSFYSYIDANFSPIYPATSVTKAQYAEYLGDSPANLNAMPVMAIRDRSNLASVYSSSGSLTLNTDVIAMADVLSSTYIMDTLLSNRGSNVRYFPFSTNSRTLEANMKFNSDQSMSQSLRDILQVQGQMTMSYLNDSVNIGSVMSASTTNKAVGYGRGYRFSFGQPVGVANGFTPLNVLQTLQEVDLSTGNVIQNWNCNRIYKIYLNRDAASCAPHTEAQIAASASLRQEIEIVRRQFRADQWDVNVTQGCLVPKATVPSCYTENTVNGVAQGVEYSAGASCYNPLIGNVSASYPNLIIPTKRCANYATICTKF
ncbi:hypothetical protein B9G69_008780 [Bdellovibrio sp. SKB1291214]|uniref:hypothetical protein n=1 Tax=Bdellovibrio sp. SKB1291214 TaxID=1732569 RepID=UPI000B51DBD7|nr:hypothetical protein [Bdellovibrio sp. SKB1291214]UYL10668.1 hypothetical protein B9G69_008780 [Bdellovibrio sp. SKB1291214]